MRIILNRINAGLNKFMIVKHSKTALSNNSIINRNNSNKRHLLFHHMSKYIVIASLLLVSSISAAKNRPDDLRQLLQLSEYIGVDYGSTVTNGKIINQSEYAEMVEFSNLIAEKTINLAMADEKVRALSQSLKKAIDNKRTSEQIQDLTAKLKNSYLAISPQLSLPTSLLSASTVEPLYQANCSSCHGISGKGDGFMASQFNPKPTNFTLQKRSVNRSILGLYDIISGGLEGTVMPSFKQLSAKQRWSLAFYTGGLAFAAEKKPFQSNDSTLTLQDLVMYSPNELIRARKQIQAESVAQLRANPNSLFKKTEHPLEVARNQTKKALLAYQQNDFENANRLAVSAYLDGFELIENNLDAHNKPFRKLIESKLINLRQQLKTNTNGSEVKVLVAEILQDLEKAQLILTDSTMSDATLFSASFIILLREGLEALLVIIALFTILVRSNEKEAIKYVHFGWASALLAGILTWLIAQHLVTISGASREIMEGIASLLAAVVLFYVGFWMHGKTQANQWQRYIKKNIDRSLKTGTLWGIAGLAFIAVYREVFETVLFYQSLLTQTIPTQMYVLIGGFGFAVLILLMIAWLMIKYSIKLPIGKFFSSTTYLLLALSFILAGKAISALQEAAIIGIAPLPFDFQVSWLGINSTWQGIGTQLTILFLSGALFLKQWFKAKV